MNSLQLAFAESWWNAWTKLDAGTRVSVMQAVEKLRRGGPKMVELHALEACDFHAFRVTQNALRVVTYLEGDSCILLHVDEHDAAYRWATSHKFRQVGSTIRLIPTFVEAPDGGTSATGPGATQKVEGPLHGIRDREFQRLDVAPVFAAWLRRIPSEDDVLEVANSLKPALGEALIELAAEPDRFDAALRTYQTRIQENASKTTLQEALQDPRNLHKFWIPPPGEEALATALQGDFEAWRVFLHPSQRRIARLDAKGPVKVTGGPGTGKTVVVLHRARHLVETTFADDPRPVLVTAFSRPLVQTMWESFERLVADRPELMERVSFMTSTAAAQAVLSDAEISFSFLTEGFDGSSEPWRAAQAHETLGLDLRFYLREREAVQARHGAWTEDDYLKAPRVGTSVRLDRKKRRAVWKVLEAFNETLREAGVGDDIELSRRARQTVQRSPYAAVVVDELQDMAPEPLRLLARLGAGDDGLPKPNGLFLAGDGYQRIFQHPVPLTHCGIDVRGRSHHLRLNYRTTEGIRAAAVEYISGQSQDPLDDGDTPGYRRYRSIRSGPRPERHTFESPAALAAWMAEHGHVTPDLLLAGTGEAIESALRDAGIASHKFGQKGDGLLLCTLHQCKGLEASKVIVVEPRGRRPAEIDSAEEWQRRQESLVYVGMTRARDWCALVKLQS